MISFIIHVWLSSPKIKWMSSTNTHAVKTTLAETQRNQLMSFSWSRTEAPWQHRTPSSSWMSLSSPRPSSYFNYTSLMRHASHFPLPVSAVWQNLHISQETKSGCVKQISGLVDKRVLRVITETQCSVLITSYWLIIHIKLCNGDVTNVSFIGRLQMDTSFYWFI